MRQLAQFQDGRLELQEVPRPVPPPGGILVRTTHSVISPGTEKMKVEQARMNLLQKARARPDQVRKVLDTARNLGWRSALEKVRNRLETPTPLGYSAAGVVEAVDPGNARFRAGDRVACGGAECAFHAEYLAVPELLAARVPEGVQNGQAAYTTMAAIALHAVRQSEARLGDRVLVLGQGLIGLLVTNLLVVSGVRVMGVDLQARRRRFCLAMGAERVVILGEQSLADEVRDWTENQGTDVSILCTSGSDQAPLQQAAAALRDRGRILVVGNTRVELDWRTFYEKEIEVRYSRAYGPGRYDPAYEWGGSDYPIGYVRWTETRNFEACLQLMKVGALRVDALTTRRVSFANALDAYQQLTVGDTDDVGVVLEYEGPSPSSPVSRTTSSVTQVEPAPRVAERLEQPVTTLDVVGAGNFARTMLLPHLQGRIRLGTVVNQTALSARHVKAKFGFANAATDLAAVWPDGAPPAPAMPPGAVLIATRQHLHAPMVQAALARGRHVFVEKPLCLTRGELAELDAAMAQTTGTVMVGFNRRFAPASVALKRALATVPGPRAISYRVAAGRLDPQHWSASMEQSGGRVLGEACHFLDYFCFLAEAAPVRVWAQPIGAAAAGAPFPDSVSAQVEFRDGSTAQLTYTAEGDPAYPKETVTLFAAGLVAELTNFQRLALYRGRKRREHRYASKGHAEEMTAWLAFLKGEDAHPFPYAAARRSMRLTFAVLESIREARPIEM